MMILYISVETLSEDEDDIVLPSGSGISVSQSSHSPQSEFTPTPGGPFSALTPSMWPEDILSKLGNQVL